MSYKMNNSYTILVAASLIVLVLVTITGFNHPYTAFAVNTKKTSTKSSTGGSSSRAGNRDGTSTAGNSRDDNSRGGSRNIRNMGNNNWDNRTSRDRVRSRSAALAQTSRARQREPA